MTEVLQLFGPLAMLGLAIRLARADARHRAALAAEEVQHQKEEELAIRDPEAFLRLLDRRHRAQARAYDDRYRLDLYPQKRKHR